MRLWTIQRALRLDELKRIGVLRAEHRIDPSFSRAYHWMAGKLTEKVGPPPDGCVWPIWAWEHCPPATYSGAAARVRPDLRFRGHLPPGEHGVRIAFDADPDKILLSSFDAWHAVLNDHYHSLDDQDYERHEALIAAKASDDSGIEALKHESWDRIFDLDLIADKPDYAVQAVLWEVPAQWIKSIDRFTAR